MTDLNMLKRTLRQAVQKVATSNLTQTLSESQYSAGFEILVQDSGWQTYQNFIIPQLEKLFHSDFKSHAQISVLEIGPGPKSVLGYLPGHCREKIRKYTAFEPNSLFCEQLEKWIGTKSSSQHTQSPFPGLKKLPKIFRDPFGLQRMRSQHLGTDSRLAEKFDLILLCHSMYGMGHKQKVIEETLELLVEKPQSGMVVVFHRDEPLYLDGLVCHQYAPFPDGVISVKDNDTSLDYFSAFIAGITYQYPDMDKIVRAQWRKICRSLGRQEKEHAETLTFRAPEAMMVFNHHAISLPEIMAQVPFVKDSIVKNREARFRRPASILRPTKVHHIQNIVHWALKHGTNLTIVGGGHSGQCHWNNIVAVDMSAFNSISIVSEKQCEGDPSAHPYPLAVVGAGCKTGEIISKTMVAGLTVPLGARPSVGAGLWLQGGIGHLSRLYGMACDAIVGAVMVSVDFGQILCVGLVPDGHVPPDSVRPKNEAEILWTIKGAGTNFGIIVSVTFKAFPAPTFSVGNWILPLDNDSEAQRKIANFTIIASEKDPSCSSADAYLYCDAEKLHMGVTVFESSTTVLKSPVLSVTNPIPNWGEGKWSGPMNCEELFDAEMYVSTMHGGHGGGKTSSFKRCLFLNRVGEEEVALRLIKAIKSRPTHLCYLHLLHGGGAVRNVPADTAFGCRDWDFACVITGVWPREEDGTAIERRAVDWVYRTAAELLPVSSGVYSADLGPGPRDAGLATHAFGINHRRLCCLKLELDPFNLLAYACPLRLPSPNSKQKLVLLITGESGAGKDYCAEIWASTIPKYTRSNLKVRVASISDKTKQEYAAATGADIDRLLRDRAYKEYHRVTLTEFFHEQVKNRPNLPEKHFTSVVNESHDVDVLFVTGMREEAPVASLSHLVPEIRLIEVYIQTNPDTRLNRMGFSQSAETLDSEHKTSALGYRPCLIFDNSVNGLDMVTKFVEEKLVKYIHPDVERLAEMVSLVPNFPRPGIEFRHVLGIAQQPGGLALCTSLLKSHYPRDWTKVNAIVCCEAGGYIFASALAAKVHVPLVLIREAGKLPPPTISVTKSPSHVSSLTSHSPEKRMEMEQSVLSAGASVVFIDDVLATGETLCAVLKLLVKAGIDEENVEIMVVGEFPVHRGRLMLRKRGYERLHIQSLLIFGGA
ncbi:hypothetical protein BS50DRAFT_579742 [Corynespora cassiicola Philippines]|uniref:FAD-binding PCMH-type domain-containing protein n=1 Tax=Corynespora cassiicola Philippines TaxID=1448308 RepID=A0A2T2N2R5_CORCC|nr:hypothetical protein BS50DRAFT_579742 [Corynespora cassiicola Philippines]